MNQSIDVAATTGHHIAKERPFLFSAPMVRAILEGRKTVTRRIVKPQPELTENAGLSWRGNVYGMRTTGEPFIGEFIRHCPYGKPGDLLWVRETWCLADPDYSRPPRDGRPFRDDDRWAWYAATEGELVEHANGKRPWRPSIHMPRWASRITLEVVDVRIERLHAITDEDAAREGVDPVRPPGSASIDATPAMKSHRYAFSMLWLDLNGDRAPWATNPWVWRIEFKKIDPLVP